MKFTRLGAAGVSVSRICLGCMSFGSSGWRPWVLDEDEARPFFQRAIEAGINFFDTADMYSLGVSEEVTGRALREYGRREELVIATKVYFPVGEGPNRKGLSRKHIIEACEASLRRLGVEAIDLYQIHRFDTETPLEETLAALDHLVTSGKVHYLGASSGWAWKLARALGISERRGWARLVSMQNHYNLIYREEEREMIPLCREEGIGIIPWSPLARGILAGARTSLDDRSSTRRAETDTYGHKLYGGAGGPHPGRPGSSGGTDADGRGSGSDSSKKSKRSERSESSDRDSSERAGSGLWEIVEVVGDIAESRGVSPAEVSLAWLLSRPGVTAPIVGATKLAHLDAAIAALDLELEAEEIARLEQPYRPQPVQGHR